MHHPVSGINSLILSVSLASHVSTHLLIHLSPHLYYHHHSHHLSLLHSFTPGLKPTFSTNPSHPGLLLPTGLPSWQRDWTGPIMLIVLFLVSHFNFLFVPCGGLSSVSWLPISFLLHVKYTLSYCIKQNIRQDSRRGGGRSGRTTPPTLKGNFSQTIRALTFWISSVYESFDHKVTSSVIGLLLILKSRFLLDIHWKWELQFSNPEKGLKFDENDSPLSEGQDV